jgi:hypothetical protein
MSVIDSSAKKTGLSVIRLENSKTLVTVTNDEPSRFELSILNSLDEIVYYKSVSRKTTDFRMVYDLSKLEPGTYKFKLKSNENVTEEVLIITR